MSWQLHVRTSPAGMIELGEYVFGLVESIVSLLRHQRARRWTTLLLYSERLVPRLMTKAFIPPACVPHLLFLHVFRFQTSDASERSANAQCDSR